MDSSAAKHEFQHGDLNLEVAWLLDGCRSSAVFEKELDFSSDVARETAAILKMAHNRVGLTVRSILDIHSVVCNIELTLIMSRRYPWHGTKINKSDHLIKLVWFQYLNLCYLYKEKIRNFCSALSSAVNLFGFDEIIETRRELKDVDSKIGKYIRLRGQAFHEWEVPHIGIHLYEAVEVMSRCGDTHAMRLRGGHYQDAKWHLKRDIANGLEFTNAHYRLVLEKYKEITLKVIVRFDAVYKAVQRGQQLSVT